MFRKTITCAANALNNSFTPSGLIPLSLIICRKNCRILLRQFFYFCHTKKLILISDNLQNNITGILARRLHALPQNFADFGKAVHLLVIQIFMTKKL